MKAQTNRKPSVDIISPHFEDVVLHFLERGRTETEASAFYRQYNIGNTTELRHFGISNWRKAADEWMGTHHPQQPISMKVNIQLNGRIVSGQNDTLLHLLGNLLQSPQGTINYREENRQQEKDRARAMRHSGKTYDEISQTLGRGKGTIHRWVHEPFSNTVH